jgi:hypothetical protein
MLIAHKKVNGAAICEFINPFNPTNPISGVQYWRDDEDSLKFYEALLR